MALNADFTIGTGVDAKLFRQKMHEVATNPPWLTNNQIQHARWNPYTFEGGSTAAISGKDFVVAATDTRMTQFDVNILTRHAEKIHPLSEKIILNSSGFYGDVLQLKRVLEARLRKFRYDYREDMSVDLCAELLSRTFYYKRFFPYYTGSVLCGIDEFGKGAVYSYDPVGTIERVPYQCSGMAEPIMMPFVDHQVAQETLSKQTLRPELTVERATAIVKDAFRLAAEREITTGDSVHIIIAQQGKPVQNFFLPLRED